MGNQKQQHYVPKCYLKNFSAADEKIFAFDKMKQKSFQTTPQYIAKESYFYDFPCTSLKDKKFMENLLCKLEASQDKLIRHLQKKVAGIKKLKYQTAFNVNVLTNDQKIELSVLVAIQFLRTRLLRNFYADVRKKSEGLKASLETDVYTMLDKLQAETEIEFEESTKSDLANFTLQLYDSATKIGGDAEPVLHGDFMLNHYDEFAKKLRSFIWMIGVNDSDTPIYTSDHPVVRFPHSSSNGLFSEGMEIVFPIDRKLILIMLEPNYFQNFAHRDCKLMQLNPDEIVQFNTLQVAECCRFVFCSHDSFDLARQQSVN